MKRMILSFLMVMTLFGSAFGMQPESEWYLEQNNKEITPVDASKFKVYLDSTMSQELKDLLAISGRTTGSAQGYVYKAIQAFADEQNDPAALYILGANPINKDLLKRSAVLGYFPAKVALAQLLTDDEADERYRLLGEIAQGAKYPNHETYTLRHAPSEKKFEQLQAARYKILSALQAPSNPISDRYVTKENYMAELAELTAAFTNHSDTNPIDRQTRIRAINALRFITIKPWLGSDDVQTSLKKLIELADPQFPANQGDAPLSSYEHFKALVQANMAANPDITAELDELIAAFKKPSDLATRIRAINALRGISSNSSSLLPKLKELITLADPEFVAAGNDLDARSYKRRYQFYRDPILKAFETQQKSEQDARLSQTNIIPAAAAVQQPMETSSASMPQSSEVTPVADTKQEVVPTTNTSNDQADANTVQMTESITSENMQDQEIVLSTEMDNQQASSNSNNKKKKKKSPSGKAQTDQSTSKKIVDSNSEKKSVEEEQQLENEKQREAEKLYREAKALLDTTCKPQNLKLVISSATTKLEKSAGFGNLDAQRELVLMYCSKGVGGIAPKDYTCGPVKRNDEKARALLEQLVAKNDAAAFSLLAQLKEDEEKYQEAALLYERYLNSLSDQQVQKQKMITYRFVSMLRDDYNQRYAHQGASKQQQKDFADKVVACCRRANITDDITIRTQLAQLYYNLYAKGFDQDFLSSYVDWLTPLCLKEILDRGSEKTLKDLYKITEESVAQTHPENPSIVRFLGVRSMAKYLSDSDIGALKEAQEKLLRAVQLGNTDAQTEKILVDHFIAHHDKNTIDYQAGVDALIPNSSKNINNHQLNLMYNYYNLLLKTSSESAAKAAAQKIETFILNYGNYQYRTLFIPMFLDRFDMLIGQDLSNLVACSQSFLKIFDYCIESIKQQVFGEVDEKAIKLSMKIRKEIVSRKMALLPSSTPADKDEYKRLHVISGLFDENSTKLHNAKNSSIAAGKNFGQR